jgi:hypothetical protein
MQQRPRQAGVCLEGAEQRTWRRMELILRGIGGSGICNLAAPSAATASSSSSRVAK